MRKGSSDPFAGRSAVETGMEHSLGNPKGSKKFYSVTKFIHQCAAVQVGQGRFLAHLGSLYLEE